MSSLPAGGEDRMRFGLKSFQFGIIALGCLAGLNLASPLTHRPALYVVEVEGDSMQPTLSTGAQLVFARLPWRLGDVVLADVGDTVPVVKRVVSVDGPWILLEGDNYLGTEVFDVTADQILSVMMCRVPFTIPWWRAGGPVG